MFTKFFSLQHDLFSTMTKIFECLEKNIPSKDISRDLLKSMNELKNMKIPKLMNIKGGNFPSMCPNEDPENLSFEDL